ncbi:FG-GAP repeat domain-containing protein [Streptomyces sp. NPDC058735]|uniref:FG-GAP repeat domain-containing protein n=1 Tax=Streptomyces sp. NPDC058735 TaxID=3346616 RepID=UPI0036B6EF3A
MGLRLTAAIGTVLAVALVGGHAVAAPVSAPSSMPVTVAKAAEAQVPYPSVSGSRLNSVGSSGFLVHEQGTPLWTSFADGSTSVVKAKSWAGEYVDASVFPTFASDVVEVVHWEGSLKVTRLRDMSTQRSVSISPNLDAPGGILAGCVGFKYFVRTGDSKSPFASRIRIGGGWNTYVQLTGGSDLNDDGRADLVAADKSGALWLYRGTGNYKAPFEKRVKIGTGGWGTYNQILAVGDIAGAPAGDLVARDRSGVLWLYLGYGDGHFAPRSRIGGGWNAYTHLVNIGDANLDDRPDLYGINRNEPTSPFLHRATGAWRTPFAVRSNVPTVFYGNHTYDLFA